MCNIEVTQKDLHDLLEIFERKSYEAGACACEDGAAENAILKTCEYLFRLDYSLIELDNTNGALSPRYPARLFMPEYEHGHMAATLTATSKPNTNNSSSSSNGYNNGTTCLNNGLNGLNGSYGSNGSNMESGIHAYVTFANPLTQLQYPYPPPTLQSSPFQTINQLKERERESTLQQTPPNTHTIYEDLYDVNKIRELITLAKYARCRQRFAMPVIMYRGKYICRSATISVMPETYGRKVVDYAYDCLNGTNYAERAAIIDDENNDPTDESLINHINDSPSPFSYDEVIKSDIQLLNALNVATIVDLMVEKRKIKYFMAVSSSEKADPENHYENFNILSLPYPGCEFFKKFRDNNYMAKNLYYNWKQSFNDAIISIPKLGPATDLDICWYDYKKWDLVLITQNYLKATLKYIQEENSGLLIHCISGWDRTPLFVSLVRLSLWADGLIHQSLNALQMAYFTLAYDWYLFGHQLPDRLKRGEDIMFFCFHVLKYITDEEFSVVEHRKRTKTSSSSGSSSVIIIKSDCCDDEPLKEDYILNFDQDSNDSFSNCSNCDMSITDNFYTTTTTTPTITAANSTTTPTITMAHGLTSRSPNPKRSKTSPISVPGAASATRQRQESTSSNGSWQVVTDTGSIDSIVNGSYMMRFVSSQQDNNYVQTVTAAAALAAAGNCIPNGNGSGSFQPHISSNGGSVHSNNGSLGGADSNSSSGSSAGNGCHTTNGGSSNTRDSGMGTAGTAAGAKTAATLRKQRLNSVRAIFIQAYGKTIGLKFKEGSAMNLATFIGTLADQLF